MKNKTVVVLVGLLVAGAALAGWLPTGSTLVPTAPTSTVLTNSSSGAVIDVTIPGISVETEEIAGSTYQVLSIPGDVLAALDIGKPQVPKLSYLLGIPDNAGVTVSVSALETRTFDNIVCYPYQTPATDNSSFPFVIDRDFYAQNTAYPAFDAQVMNTGVWRELSVGNIQVYPVHYNPALKQLNVYSRFRVNVSYTGGAYVRKTIPTWLASTYARYIDNFGQLDLDVAETDNPGVKYLVISHDNWYNNPGLESLLAWQYKRGVETRLVHKASWTAQEIKDSITAEYGRSTPAVLRWVLLVGEYADIPMYSMGGVGRSDYWYSDILPTSPDNYPEIGLSRLSPSSPMDLQNQIAKILKYEKNPPATANWLRKHALIACSQEYPGKYSACIRGIYNEPMGWWRYDFDTLMCQYHGNDSIARIINEGRSVVTYRGHGDIDQWYTMALQGGAPWYIANVNALTNGDLTPMVYNIACLCGDIYQATCLSEAWMRKYPGGAVGSMAATQASYTYPNHGICSTLVRSMCDTWTITVPGVRDYTMPVWDIGWIQCNVDAYVAKYWPGSPYPDNIYMYLNLGDPAMEVWAGGMPQIANVTYPPTVPIGPYSLPVTVQIAGVAVERSLVCAWKGIEFYVTGYTDNNGQVTLPINAATPGQFSVTVSTGHKVGAPPADRNPIFPFEGTCMAETGTSPYVLYLRSTIDDAPPGGNGDGLVNPGEAINLPTWVKNYGGAAAIGVTGRLRVTGPFITVTDSVKSFGDIAAGDSAFTGSDGFNFTVASACTNAHRIDLVLNIKDASESLWVSHIYITVGAPALNYAGQTIDDPPPGNNNHRLDPGETAYLIVSLANSGIGHAQNVTAGLTSGDARLTVLDSLGTFGLIPADSTRSNDADRFQVSAVSGIVPGTNLPCTLHVRADGGYAATRSFMISVGGFISPGATLLDHDTGYCLLTVSAFGALGYDQPTGGAGNGFKYPKTVTTGLYYGGMLCGNSAAYMVDHYYGVPASSIQSDWVMSDSLRFYPPDVGDEMARCAYTDAGHSSPHGLKVTQTSYQNAAPGYDDFVVIVYDYENTGAADINGLYSGIMCDLDIGTATTNVARTDDTRRAAFMRQEASPNPIYGIKLLYPYTAANLSAIDHDIYVYPTDTAMNEGMKYRFLNGQLHAASSNRSYDWSVVVSAGPFDLPVSGRQRNVYALVGGSDSANFNENCDSAQSWFDRHVAVKELSGSSIRRPNALMLTVSPNPFAHQVNLSYSAPIKGILEVNAYDAGGRRVAVLAHQEVNPGVGTIHWEPGKLANGIYFIKTALGKEKTVTKALLLR
jgi:hypothetical protein